ncbi:MAG: hypothetical protein IJR67_01700 [Acholeplasmatales bacterium]|nr:hypothetical protein [Acholeplasmatales bacterium]
MNYILIMTEGSDELAFINVLLEKGILKFKREELLMEDVYHARQITGELMGYIQLLPSGDSVSIYRIGDKLSDNLKIPKNILSEKITVKYDISTTPEFEVLFILREGLYDEYLKVKSIKKPSEFYKEHNSDYKKQSSFVKRYFDSMTNDEIVNLINLYVSKHGKTHKLNQLTLKEIICY